VTALAVAALPTRKQVASVVRQDCTSLITVVVLRVLQTDTIQTVTAISAQVISLNLVNLLLNFQFLKI
jgi:hypothetical protein